MGGETDRRRAATGAIVLAGGRSSRLAAGGIAPPGGKAGLLLGGRALLERVVAAVTVVAARTVVVAAPGQTLPEMPAEVTVVHDTRPGAGPLAALADGLAVLAGPDGPRRVVIVSCDVPLVRPALLEWLLDRLEWDETPSWVVPEVDGHLQVLLSAARPGLLPEIAAWLATGRRDPRSLVDRLRSGRPGAVAIVGAEALRGADPDLASFRDLDTVENLEELRRFLAARGES